MPSTDPKEIAFVEAMRLAWEADPTSSETAFCYYQAWYLFSQKEWLRDLCNFPGCLGKSKGFCDKHLSLMYPPAYRGFGDAITQANKDRRLRFQEIGRNHGVVCKWDCS